MGDGWHVLSLFSGIGGLELGLERAGMTVVGQVEINEFCRQVLAKHWPDVERHDDVRTAVEWWRSAVRPAVDVVAGGFPCQPVSVAGRRLGRADERWLWPAFANVLRGLRPRVAILENVTGLLGRGAGDVLGDLASLGYDAEWDCVPAAAVGAPHLRDRWFCVAYADGQRQPQPTRVPDEWRRRTGDGRQALADADSKGSPWRSGEAQGRPESARRLEPQRLGDGRPWERPTAGRHWASEPGVGRVAHGVPGRVDRVRALGNAVVPQVAEYIGRMIMERTAA